LRNLGNKKAEINRRVLILVKGKRKEVETKTKEMVCDKGRVLRRVVSLSAQHQATTGGTRQWKSSLRGTEQGEEGFLFGEKGKRFWRG